jgi:glucokinase
VAGWNEDGTPRFLETLTAGPALERIYAEKSSESLSLREISARAGKGDTLAAAVIREGAALLGHVLNPAILTIDPHLLIIGGGVPEIGALWWDAFESALRAGNFPAPKQVEIRRAKFTFNAVMIGAGMLGWSLIRPRPVT